jgi:hypothetical protein
MDEYNDKIKKLLERIPTDWNVCSYKNNEYIKIEFPLELLKAILITTLQTQIQVTMSLDSIFIVTSYLCLKSFEGTICINKNLDNKYNSNVILQLGGYSQFLFEYKIENKKCSHYSIHEVFVGKFRLNFEDIKWLRENKTEAIVLGPDDECGTTLFFNRKFINTDNFFDTINKLTVNKTILS